MKQGKEYPLNNPAKSSPQDRKKSPERILKEQKEKKTHRSKWIGTLITVLQGVASIAFLAMLFALDILPFKYVGIVFLLLAVAFLFTQKTQGKRGIHIAGKIIGVLMTIFLALGIYGLVVVNMAFDSIIVDSSKEGEAQAITESVFSVYMDDDKESKVLVVNTETHQILEITTPDKLYITIPGVSEGQKDTLENAKQYGEDAVSSALGALYETNIPFYIDANMDELQTLVEGGSPNIILRPNALLHKVDNCFKTNLTKGQIRQLIKLYVSEEVIWEIYPVSASGFSSNHKTYTNPEKEELVLEPNKEVIAKIIKLITRMEDGEKLDASDLKTN